MSATVHRIAVASRDGKLVYHFGQTDRFLIYEVVQKTATFLETRTTDPACANEPKEAGHDNQITKIGDMLTDCSAVLVTKIGPGALRIVVEKGIKPIEGATFVDEAIEQYLQKLN